MAMKSRDRVAAQNRGKVYTEILPYSAFYLAEDYHQKYTLQQRQDLWRELKAIYPDTEDLVNSTAAARINGYLSGHGNLEMVEAELGRLGLSAAQTRSIIEKLKRSGVRWRP